MFVDPFQFWKKYNKILMSKIRQSKCDLNSSIVRSYMEEIDVPTEAIIKEMYTDRPSDLNGYKGCVLFHQCLPENCDISQKHLIFATNGTKCLSKEYLKKYECKNKDRIFQVINKFYKLIKSVYFTKYLTRKLIT